MALDVGELLIGLGGGGVVGTAISAVLQRRKLGADTAAVLSKTALELVEPLKERIDELQDEVDTLRTKVRETTQELDDCRAESRAKDHRIRELEDAQYDRQRPQRGSEP